MPKIVTMYGALGGSTEDYLNALAAKAEIPMPPPGWPAQSRYDYLVQFEQRARGVMAMLPQPTVAGDVLQAADDFKRQFTAQSSTLWQIAQQGGKVAVRFASAQFLAFVWAVFLASQRGMTLHLPEYQQAALQAGRITAQALAYDYKVRLGVFHMIVLAADSGILNGLFAAKGGRSTQGLGLFGIDDAAEVALVIGVVLIIALAIVGSYFIYLHNKLIGDCLKDPNISADAKAVCLAMAQQEGDVAKNIAENSNIGAVVNKAITAAMWVGLIYVGILLLPNIITAVSASRSRAAA